MDFEYYIANWLPILIIVGIIALNIAIFYYRRQARLRAWGEIAARNSLTLEPGGFLQPPRVTGTYRGRNLVLSTFQRGSGKHSRTYTRIALTVNNWADIRMELYNEHVFSGIVKRLGMQDIQIGDEEIDRRFMIKGQPEEAVMNLLDSGTVRQKLREALSLKIELHEQTLWCEVRGELLDPGYLQFLFDLLSDMGDRLEQEQRPWS